MKFSSYILAFFGLLMCASFSYFAIEAYNFKSEIPQYIYDVYNYTSFFCIGIIFLVIGKNEKDKKLKYLVFYTIASFYLIILLNYILNDLFDSWVKTHRANLLIILSSLLCLFIYLWEYVRCLVYRLIGYKC